MAESELHAALGSGGRDGFAVFHVRGHGLFKQDMPAVFHRGDGDLAVGVARSDDVDDVEAGLSDHVQAVGENLRLRVKLGGLGSGCFGGGRDGDKPGVWIVEDGFGVVFSPGTKTCESETNGL